MADGGDELTILEHTCISPASGAVENSQPLSFLDKYWITYFPIHQLCFYDYNHSESHFTQTLVPSLKQSLSITLQHFFPYAGNLIVPTTSSNSSAAAKAEIRYTKGDSVSLTIAECTTIDFNYLTGNHPRDSDKFYPLVPRLGHITKSSYSLKVPLLAVQVTLFPNHGICIGVTTHHVACDGNARVRFLKAWASITKFGNDKSFVASGSTPFHDRSIVKTPEFLGESFWNLEGDIRMLESQPSRHLSGPSNKVRGPFILTRAQINRLKDAVLAQRPNIQYVSSFIVACGHIWRSMAKLHATIEDEDDKGEDKLEQIICVADLRARLDPPLPATYFGNCLGPCVARAKRSQLVGEEGFINAVELIREAILKRFSSKENIYEDVKTWKKQVAGPPTTIGITGSPKFNVNDTDFGWGKPKKCEAISTDYTASTDYSASISLSVTKESEDDLEMGLSLPKIQMDVFVTIFDNGLEINL